jgi:hypothetical protein
VAEIEVKLTLPWRADVTEAETITENILLVAEQFGIVYRCKISF